MNWTKFALVFSLLAAGAVLATRGTSDPQVSLSSVVDLWNDTLRDTDQIGMKITRVSDAEEMKIGADLARGVTDMGSEDADSTRYVTAVAQPLLSHLRRPGIHYQFHVIDSPQINAFALPGGQIFVMSGLLEFVESEAELTAVLGHEMSHVDLRHCIERYQYEAKLRKAGAPELGWMVEMAHRLVMLGFSPQQELEADAQGERLSVESGYDPDAEPALFTRMKTKFHEPSRVQATTPAGEVSEAAGEAIQAYFRTHPPSQERVARLNDMLARHRQELAQRSFYVGKENLRERVPKSSHQYAGEFREISPR
ncbi:MAG: M48 family metalloprotease [Bryobacteraceae bacterium]|jgi:predicted Zn-dependent protease